MVSFGNLLENFYAPSELLCSFRSFTSFCEIIKEFDFIDSFLSTEDGSLTVFVPTNAAFEASEGNEDFDFFSLTSEQSINVLMYHVIITEENALYYNDLECGRLTRTANRQCPHKM